MLNTEVKSISEILKEVHSSDKGSQVTCAIRFHYADHSILIQVSCHLFSVPNILFICIPLFRPTHYLDYFFYPKGAFILSCDSVCQVLDPDL